MHISGQQRAIPRGRVHALGDMRKEKEKTTRQRSSKAHPRLSKVRGSSRSSSSGRNSSECGGEGAKNGVCLVALVQSAAVSSLRTGLDLSVSRLKELRRQAGQAQIAGQLFGRPPRGGLGIQSRRFAFCSLERNIYFYTVERINRKKTLPSIIQNGHHRPQGAPIPLQGPQIHLLHRFRWHHHIEGQQ